MLLTISHRTSYAYDRPVGYGLTRLRLVPRNGPLQRVRDWRLSIEGATEQVAYRDQFGNDTRLIAAEGLPHQITITARGTVETEDSAGVVGAHRGAAPLWLFQRPTALTQGADRLADLVAGRPGAAQGLDGLHDLMGRVADAVTWRVGDTDAATTAEQALTTGSGVCQDQAHVFIAAARALGWPARYVSGYLRMDDRTEQAASHAWAEAHVDGLGWVGFDVANRICPDARYVRIATGRDYADAAPITGLRFGAGAETLDVQLTVASQQQA
ncbi:transglutaminase domain-containing protein [Paracoccus sp. p4-l81]|uniref:transglutaminase family protein n=1 Tax=unclassified Paracoccus (in: a-proteobacteria) TaxID=2688777 RepID=UPI0035B8CF4F